MEVPTENFDLAVIDQFPTVTKRYMVESSIEGRYDRNFLSTNGNIYNGAINDNYLEFTIPGADGEFTDLSNISMELKVRLIRPDGIPVDHTDTVTLTDGFFHRLFQSHSVFLNGVQVEGSNHFGLINNLKTYTSMGAGETSSVGMNMGYKSPHGEIVETVTVNNLFNGQDGDIATINQMAQGVIHMMGKLNLDISTADSYLLDNVEIRIRLELGRACLVLLAATNNEAYTYRIDMCKLWTRKVVPSPGAILSLNRSMNESGDSVSYLFDRPLVKTIIFPAGQRNLTVDNPFNDIVPHKLMVFSIDQASSNGVYNRNANYFDHGSLSDLSLELNGNCLSKVKANFPGECAQALFHTTSALGDCHSLITRKNFAIGRSIFVFDTRISDAEGTVNLERKAYLRMSINYSVAGTANRIVYIVGFTTGIIKINSLRRIFTSYLQ